MRPLLLLSFLVLIGACYEEEPRTYSDYELIAGQDAFGKSWKITGIEVTGLGSLDPFPCIADNNIVFYTDGRYENSEGYVKCDPNDPPAFEGNWYFNSRSDSMTISLEDSVRSWSVDYLSDYKMRLTSEFANDSRTYVFSVR